MKNKKFYAILVAIMLFACGFATAQTETYLNFGLSLPTGDFADGEGNDFALFPFNGFRSKEGGAGVGASLGFKFKFPSKTKGLGVLLSVDGIYNGLNKDVKDYFEEYSDYQGEEWDDFTLRKPRYINVPVLVGLNYCFDANDNLGIYGEAGIGLDARFITSYCEEMESSDSDWSREISNTYKFDPAVAFAFQLGAGILINDRFTLGVNLYNLGSAKVEGKCTCKWKEYQYGYYDSDSEKSKFKGKSLSTTMVLFRFGIKL